MKKKTKVKTKKLPKARGFKKPFVTTGFVIFTRPSTPMEKDGQCLVYRAMADAKDDLAGMYKDVEKNTWRISTVTLNAVIPVQRGKK